MAAGTGVKTSEFKLTAVIIVIGAILDGVGILLETLQAGGVAPSWLPPVLVVVGSLMVVAKALGYTRSRTLLKLAELQPKGVQAVSATAPFVQELVKVLREELRKPEQLPAPQVVTVSATPPPGL